MKHVSLCFLLAALLLPPAAYASSGPILIKSIVVKHFTNGNGVSQSTEFINYFAEFLTKYVEKDKIAGQVIQTDTVNVLPGDAADSLVFEGKFTSFEKGSFFTNGKLGLEIDMYRVSDHALIKVLTPTPIFKSTPMAKDKNIAEFTSMETGRFIKQALVNLTVSTAVPLVNPQQQLTNPTPMSGNAPVGSDAVASILLSSVPTGAEITADGNYIGSTPSTIKLRPGTHSIKITMKGYVPWVRTIDTAAGESRNLVATLDAVTP